MLIGQGRVYSFVLYIMTLVALSQLHKHSMATTKIRNNLKIDLKYLLCFIMCNWWRHLKLIANGEERCHTAWQRMCHVTQFFVRPYASNLVTLGLTKNCYIVVTGPKK